MEEKRKEEILRILGKEIRGLLEQALPEFEKLQEIRLRLEKPILLLYENEPWFLTRDGRLSKKALEGRLLSPKELRETMEYISNYSLYAYEEELKQGFLTIPGGHRVGICGQAVTDESGIQSIRYISSLNIRMAHEIIGCSKKILPYLEEGGSFLHTLLVSSPGGGKTTLLRDLILQLSERYTIGVVDERSEIAACYMGAPQNQVGIRTDVLDCCPKAEGMMLLIRSMAPDIVAVDEIGGEKDDQAIRQAVCCGSRVLATIHGSTYEEVRRKKITEVFQRFVLLNKKAGAGSIGMIMDEAGRQVAAW